MNTVMRYIPAFLTILGLSGLPVSAQMSVLLVPSTPSPAPLGTVVVWTASVSNGLPGRYWYRFQTETRPRSSVENEPGPGFYRTAAISNSADSTSSILRTAVDYGPNPTFTWSPIDQEGTYAVDVSAENKDTGDVASARAYFEFTPLASP